MEIKEILLVDEKTPIISAIGFILQSRGYLTVLAPNAETASAELDNYCFDLMLVYLAGQEQGKLALLQQAKRRSPLTKIMVAGNPLRQPLPIEAFQAEVDDYLLVPFSSLELCHRVERCLKEDIARVSEFKAEQINARILNSLKLSFRDLHNSFVYMLSGLRIANDNVVTQNDHNRFGMLSDISKNLSKCYSISENFLYKTYICNKDNDYRISKTY